MNNTLFSPRRVTPLLAVILVLLLANLACGAISAQEPGDSTQATAPAIAPTSQPGVAVTVQPAIPERRYLTFEFPPRMRAGDSDNVRLTLEVDDQGNIVPTAEIEGNVVQGDVIEIPNLYETHHIVAEARFDMAGMEIRPSELVSEPISQGQTAVFYWSIRPNDVGIYRGTIWFYLRFIDKSSGEESRKTVSAQRVEIEAVNFIGIPVNVARSLGVAGSVLGTILGFPFFEDIVKYFLRKRPKK